VPCYHSCQHRPRPASEIIAIGALLGAGLVDEVAVIINPSLAGNPGNQLFVTHPSAIAADGLPLTLREIDKLDGGAVWLF
jgi:2,5-diamino-6-(ribosylamino)-4(3H)-pyrimidinone 5'-phosphate reductase